MVKKAVGGVQDIIIPPKYVEVIVVRSIPPLSSIERREEHHHCELATLSLMDGFQPHPYAHKRVYGATYTCHESCILSQSVN